MRAEIRIILHQLLVIILAVAVAKYLYASLAAMGVLYGGLISVSTSAIMAYRMAQAARKAAEGSLKGNLYVYLGAIERICIAIVLFALGFSWLNFSPLPMVIGLMAGQIGFMIGAFKVKD
ncbi:hypothetical protein A9Q80_04535 [Cycloclasticus sp. 46_83_sub15_T18]|nr:hypothetical protein A9Q80_04535 [Cycloclasticus sp. 46_83_sub15_T18]